MLDSSIICHLPIFNSCFIQQRNENAEFVVLVSLAIISLPSEVGKILRVFNIQAWNWILTSLSSLPAVGAVLVRTCCGGLGFCSPCVHGAILQDDNQGMGLSIQISTKLPQELWQVLSPAAELIEQFIFLKLQGKRNAAKPMLQVGQGVEPYSYFLITKECGRKPVSTRIYSTCRRSIKYNGRWCTAVAKVLDEARFPGEVSIRCSLHCWTSSWQ